MFALDSRNILYGDLVEFLIQDEAAAEFAKIAPDAQAGNPARDKETNT